MEHVIVNLILLVSNELDLAAKLIREMTRCESALADDDTAPRRDLMQGGTDQEIGTGVGCRPLSWGLNCACPRQELPWVKDQTT